MSPARPLQIKPRRRMNPLAWALAVVVGVSAGIGGYTFSYAKGLSYFSTEPSACANCHIMQRQLESYRDSSHHGNAVCIDCHLPHDFVPKYLAKAENGWRHSKEFTAQTFAEPIAIKPEGRRILQKNCERCHAALVDAMHDPRAGDAPDCTHCHAGAGHGERAALGGPLRAKEEED